MDTRLRTCLAMGLVASLSITAASCGGGGGVDPIEPSGPTSTTVVIMMGAVPAWVYEPGPGLTVDLGGVNLAGAEFGETNLPGRFGTDYTYPTSEEIDYFVGKGMNVFRLPFRWERLQQTLMGELDAEELGSIEEFVEHATNAGADVILDPHNYARYGEHVIGSAEVSNEAFADFWRRLATKFANNDAVIFGLVNEPSELGPNGTENWLVSANLAIAAIREAGAQNLVLVPGNGWSGGASWYDDYYGTPNAEIMGGVVDPADNFAFEIHQYLDENSSGSGDECVSRSIGSERLDEVTRWAADGGHQLFLGEFGAPATETCFFAIDDLLKYLGENDDVWLGWAWWAAGPWWGDYPLSIEPEGGDHPQMDLLERHLSPE